MSHRLSGKTALVTGGSSGIGLAIVERFVAEGAYVFATGRRQVVLDGAVEHLGGRVTTVRADSSKAADLDSLFSAIAASGRSLDILVANAGGPIKPQAVTELSEAEFDATVAGNFKAVFLTVQKAIPLMNRGASLILVGSTTSLTGLPSLSAYAASKAAIRNLARSWAVELGSRGFRVNALTPGPVLTPGLTGMVPPQDRAGFLEGIAADVPLGRLGKPSEIAGAAVFLASDDSSFVNGAELCVDGGQAQV